MMSILRLLVIHSLFDRGEGGVVENGWGERLMNPG